MLFRSSHIFSLTFRFTSFHSIMLTKRYPGGLSQPPGLCVVTDSCIYRHLPIVYHFSFCYFFPYGIYALNLLTFPDYRGIITTFCKGMLLVGKSHMGFGSKRPRVRIPILRPKRRKGLELNEFQAFSLFYAVRLVFDIK